MALPPALRANNEADAGQPLMTGDASGAVLLCYYPESEEFNRRIRRFPEFLETYGVQVEAWISLAAALRLPQMPITACFNTFSNPLTTTLLYKRCPPLCR